MATVLRTWCVREDRLVEIPELTSAEQGLIENRLETWLYSNSEAIQDSLLIIGRQIETASGPLDLLGLTVEGRPVVLELKRDRAPRETVAQAIDYASWVASQAEDDFLSLAEEKLGKSLEDAFMERFSQALPDLQLLSPVILVVAARLDAATERMIRFLSEQYGMDIDGLVFRYIRLSEGDEILIRTSVVPDKISGASGGSRRSSESLLAEAQERGIAQLVDTLRKLREFLVEQPRHTFGGSFRYWLNNRMVCGVNVAGYWQPPSSTVDVWVNYAVWQQETGVPDILPQLSQFETVKHYEGDRRLVVRIKSQEEAERLVAMASSWLQRDPDPGLVAQIRKELLQAFRAEHRQSWRELAISFKDRCHWKDLEAALHQMKSEGLYEEQPQGYYTYTGPGAQETPKPQEDGAPTSWAANLKPLP